MSFLKKAGSFILKYVGVILGLVPLVAPAVGVPGAVVGEITQVGNLIISIEQMFAAAFGLDAKKGSDKLKAAVPFVAQIIQRSDFMVGKKIKDEAAFQAASTAITSGFADLLNSLGE